MRIGYLSTKFPVKIAEDLHFAGIELSNLGSPIKNCSLQTANYKMFRIKNNTFPAFSITINNPYIPKHN